MATDLAAVQLMANKQLDLERQVVEAEKNLSDLKEQLRHVKEETIPMMMQELDLQDFTLSTGEKVKCKREVYASIPAANKEDAYNWLVEHDFGSIIKTEMVAEFGRGELEKAQSVQLALAAQGLTTSLTQSVHAQTLKAFLKEQIEAGKDIPLDLFGARPVWTTEIKAPRQTKKANT